MDQFFNNIDVPTDVATLRVDPEKKKIAHEIKLIVYGGSDAISTNIRVNGIWEKIETQYTIDTIKPGDVAIDLGANIGYFSVIIGNLVGPSGKVYAFEPNDRNFLMLKNNLTFNKLDNVQVFKAVAGATCGVARLYEFVSDNQGAHQITTVGSTYELFEKSSLHPMITVDSLMAAGVDKVDFIKLDTQGAEPLILHGGRELIKANSSHLNMVVEFNGLHMEKQYGIKPFDYYRYILDLGFDGFFIDARDGAIKPIDDFKAVFKMVTTADGEVWPKNLFFFDAVFKPSVRKSRRMFGWRNRFPAKMKNAT